MIDVAENRLLIRLDQPIRYRGDRLSCVIVQARHVGDSVADVESTEMVPANLTFLRRGAASLADTVARAEQVGAIGGIQRA